MPPLWIIDRIWNWLLILIQYWRCYPCYCSCSTRTHRYFHIYEGFGLVNSYITNSAFSGMSMSLLIFALAIQHYFLMRAFWYKAGVYSESAGNTFSDSDRFNQVSYANKGEDLQLMTYNLPVSSMADAIACSISLLIAFSPVIGRVSLLEVFFLTLFGSWVYELNNLLLWRLYITDSGYGMRVFVFGSFLGLISAIILGKQ